MAYTALYRKWRPKGFKDVIGQEHIVKTLKNQIESGRLAHAYLFCGTRGTGKTSTAKIFAKTVNCIDSIDGEPCDKCQSCKNIIAERSMNVIEIDAASNNGVDNIRDIREEVKYPPTEGRYKVYIIDEVHMLSIGAFNALLKTLEEPPEHIIFILATTDPQKIPATILSRCQRYDFRRININDMSKRLAYFMKEENIVVEDKALKYISKLSDGAMRDALSILDQCIAFYYGEDITFEKVLDTVGAVDNEVFYKLTDALIQKDSIECMNVVEDIIVQGRDISQFVTGVIVHFRNLLIAKTSKTKDNILDLSQDNIELLSKQAENIIGSSLINFIQEFSALEAKLKYSGNDRILLEVLLIKVCQTQVVADTTSYAELLNRITNLELNRIKNINTAKEMTQQKVSTKPKPKPAIPEDIKEAIELWDKIKHKFGYPLNAVLEDTTAEYLGNSIYYIKGNSGINPVIEKRLDEIVKALENETGKVFQIKLITDSEFKYEYTKLYGNTQESDNSEFCETCDIISTQDDSMIIEYID